MKVRRLFIFSFLILLNACAHQQAQHTFKKGETLERIRHRYQISSERLAELNAWAELDKLLPDDMNVKLSPKRGPLKARYAFRMKQREPAVKKAVYVLNPQFMWPTKGKLSSRYGRRWGTMHQGIDISAPRGTAIKAVRQGRVIHSGYVSGYGKLVILYHGQGMSTVYAHATKLLAKKGDRVKRGQHIALVGSTGRSTAPHLHFEVRRYKAAVDPLKFLR